MPPKMHRLYSVWLPSVMRSFVNHPADNSGTLSVGRDFDYRFRKHDETARPVPFCPEVYKKNAVLQIEKGYVVHMQIE